MFILTLSVFNIIVPKSAAVITVKNGELEITTGNSKGLRHRRKYGLWLRQWNSPIRSLFESFSPEGQILFLNVYARDFQMGDRFVHTTIKACLAVMPY